MFSWYWQTLWQTDCVPENYTNTKSFSVRCAVRMFNIYAHFLLACVSQEEWLQRCELSNLLLDSVPQDVLPYLSFFFFCLHNIPFGFCVVVIFLELLKWSHNHSIVRQSQSLTLHFEFPWCYLLFTCCFMRDSNFTAQFFFCVSVYFGYIILYLQRIQMPSLVVSPLQDDWSQ